MSEFDPIADAILNDRPLPTGDGSDIGSATDQKTTEDSNPDNGSSSADTSQDGSQGANHQEPNPSQASDSPNDWLSNVSKIVGEEIKSEDDLKNFVQLAKNNQSLESQLEAIRQENEALKGNSPKFANERIEKLNELYAKGASDDQIKAFEKINSVGELSEIKPLDAVKLALQLRDGLTAEEAEIKLKNTYKLDEEVYDAETIAASNIELKLDAKKDLDYLQSYKAKVSDVPAAKEENSDADFQKKIADYVANVTPIANSIKDKFNAITGVNVNGAKDDQAILVDLPISEESKANVARWVTEYAAANEVPLTPEGIAGLEEFAKRTLILNNFDSIAIHINSMAEERIRKQFENPANINRGVDAPTGNSNDAAKNLEQFILNS